MSSLSRTVRREGSLLLLILPRGLVFLILSSVLLAHLATTARHPAHLAAPAHIAATQGVYRTVLLVLKGTFVVRKLSYRNPVDLGRCRRKKGKSHANYARGGTTAPTTGQFHPLESAIPGQCASKAQRIPGLPKRYTHLRSRKTDFALEVTFARRGRYSQSHALKDSTRYDTKKRLATGKV